MNNLVFDSPDVVGMDEFLKYIYEIKKNNNIIITKDIVYHELDRIGLDKNNIEENRQLIDIDYMLKDFYSNYLKDNNNEKKSAYRNKYFLFFENNKDEKKEFIKLYIPFDKKNIYECVNIMLDFLNKENISHCSKVCKNIRNDDFTIRLRADDIENTHKIIEFIKNNRKLRNGLLKVNPFVPCIDGIGVMKEKGISYNDEMSGYIAKFIEKSYRDKNDVNLKEFIHYFETICKNNDIKKIFNTNFMKNNEIEEFDNRIDKKHALDNAIIVTYRKYGLKHVIVAITKALNSDFSFFSRGEKEVNYRKILMDNLDPCMIKNIIGLKDDNDISLINDYCASLLRSDIDKEFDKICCVTMYNYDLRQTERAILNVVEKKDYNGFSRFLHDSNDKKNYRELAKMYTGYDIMRIIKNSLIFDGVDITKSNDELVKEYSKKIEKMVDKKINEISR